MLTSISLIGMPGGGKTTAGRHLAKRLRVPFVDTDSVIETRVGESVRSYFEREGEAAFRDVEEATVRELLQGSRGVVATGGGVVLREGNRRELRTHSTVIYLRSTPEELFRRLRHDTRRPLLQVRNPLARLRELYVQRDPLYRSTAHFVIDTGRPALNSLVNMILMQLELAGVVSPDHTPSPINPRVH